MYTLGYRVTWYPRGHFHHREGDNNQIIIRTVYNKHTEGITLSKLIIVQNILIVQCQFSIRKNTK